MRFHSVYETQDLPSMSALSRERATVRLGLVVNTGRGGLHYQSEAFRQMLKPDKVLYVNSEILPTFAEYEEFLKDIDAMLTAETPYVYEAWNWARMAGVRTFCVPNWEFFDGLIQPNMPHPDQYIMPSYWHLEEMQELFPGTVYLPQPTPSMGTARLTNIKREGKRRFVHIVGTNAIYDRNGWTDLRDCLANTKSEFELVVYSQAEITGIADPRVKYHIFDIENQEELYTDFDALILPRRYGGLCLPMQEALTAGLPVIMPDISPNNRILPKHWLLPAEVTAQFEGRATIDVYSSSGLAEKLGWLCSLSDEELRTKKELAYSIGSRNYSFKVLLSKYEQLLNRNRG